MCIIPQRNILISKAPNAAVAQLHISESFVVNLVLILTKEIKQPNNNPNAANYFPNTVSAYCTVRAPGIGIVGRGCCNRSDCNAERDGLCVLDIHPNFSSMTARCQVLS